MLSDIEGERGLSHGWPASDDDQIPWLKTGGFLIEIMEAGRNSSHVAGGIQVVERFNTLDNLLQQRLNINETLLSSRTCFGNFKHPRFRLIQEGCSGTPRRIVGGIRYLGPDLCQPAHYRPFPHDLRVATDIGRGRRILYNR